MYTATEPAKDEASNSGSASSEPEPLDDEVLEILSSLIAFKNRADANGWRDAFENMPVYLERVGLLDDIKKLRVIHVAGTKGKGSTCAMVERMLRGCGYKTGLFTSPHLVDVRERVRINGDMLGKGAFESAFWWCYKRLQEQATPEVGVPGYFRFITLLALKVFADLGVDVVVLEVGVGGRLDATNVIPAPAATAVTSLGLDHVEMLGDTIPKIAREKAGIFKPGCPAFSVGQPQDAMEVLQEVASRVGAPLQEVRTLDQYAAQGGEPIDVGLGGEHQRVNAGLAVQLAATFEADAVARGCATPGAAERVRLLQQGVLPAVYAQGLHATQWPGRSQVIHDAEVDAPAASTPGALEAACTGSGQQQAQHHQAQARQQAPSSSSSTSRLSFFIDGAHTPESMVTCADWFAGAVRTQQQPVPAPSAVQRVLVFNCMKERDPALLLPALAARLAARGISINQALFVPPESQYGFLPTKRTPTPPSTSTAAPAAAQSGAQQQQQPPAPAAPAPGLPDYTWQVQLQRVWETQCLPHGHGEGRGAAAAAAAGPGSAASGAGACSAPGQAAPRAGLLPALPQTPGLLSQDPSRGAVAPSLRATLAWLRSVARSQPQLQLQVLVAGSLYLVGDTLRLLGKPPK